MTTAELSDLYTDQSFVRLIKLEALSRETGAMLKTGYWVEGILQAPISTGETIRLLRHRRPRWADDPEGTPEIVERLGLFESSEIQKIDHNLLYTQNSIWQIEEVAKT